MTVQELIEELQVYVDIGYGWMSVVDEDRLPIDLQINSDDSPSLIVTNKQN